MTPYQKAIAFATDAHKNRTKSGTEQRYDGKPYGTHLADVEANVVKWFSDLDMVLVRNLQVAAWLHDTIEDTDVTFEELELEFGNVVVKLVDTVTNSGEGTRKEQFETVYTKLQNHSIAVPLKLADRIANVEASIVLHFKHPERKQFLSMYIAEHPRFAGALKFSDFNQLRPAWKHLRELLSDPAYAFYEVMRGTRWDELLVK